MNSLQGGRLSWFFYSHSSHLVFGETGSQRLGDLLRSLEVPVEQSNFKPSLSNSKFLLCPQCCNPHPCVKTAFDLMIPLPRAAANPWAPNCSHVLSRLCSCPVFSLDPSLPLCAEPSPTSTQAEFSSDFSPIQKSSFFILCLPCSILYH